MINIMVSIKIHHEVLSAKSDAVVPKFRSTSISFMKIKNRIGDMDELFVVGVVDTHDCLAST